MKKKKAKRWNAHYKNIKKNSFYSSTVWKITRAYVLEQHGCKCQMCGRSPKLHGIVIHVDHIKPRSKYPELALDVNNLQVLCEDCNVGKLDRFITDYRIKTDISLDWEALENIPVTMQ